MSQRGVELYGGADVFSWGERDACTVLVGCCFGTHGGWLNAHTAQASHLPESNAVSLEILADYYPGYW